MRAELGADGSTGKTKNYFLENIFFFARFAVQFQC